MRRQSQRLAEPLGLLLGAISTAALLHLIISGPERGDPADANIRAFGSEPYTKTQKIIAIVDDMTAREKHSLGDRYDE